MKAAVSGTSRALVLAAALLLMPQFVLVVTAAQDTGHVSITADAARHIEELVRAIPRRVAQESRNGAYHREQRRLGIAAYVREQAAARAAARAEQARLANDRVSSIRPPSREQFHI
jgi:hypothetical protein